MNDYVWGAYKYDDNMLGINTYDSVYGEYICEIWQVRCMHKWKVMCKVYTHMEDVLGAYRYRMRRVKKTSMEKEIIGMLKKNIIWGMKII